MALRLLPRPLLSHAPAHRLPRPPWAWLWHHNHSVCLVSPDPAYPSAGSWCFPEWHMPASLKCLANERNGFSMATQPSAAGGFPSGANSSPRRHWATPGAICARHTGGAPGTEGVGAREAASPLQCLGRPTREQLSPEHQHLAPQVMTTSMPPENASVPGAAGPPGGQCVHACACAYVHFQAAVRLRWERRHVSRVVRHPVWVEYLEIVCKLRPKA